MVYADSQVVDEHDNVIGQMQLPDALKSGAILQVSRVFLFDENQRILLQKRGPKVMAPNKWNESASGHVDAGESYETTAYREVEEELGITVNDLQKIDYRMTNEMHGTRAITRFQTVYKGVIASDTKITIQESEVSEVQWIEPTKLDDWINDAPQDFTRGFAAFYQRFREETSQTN